MTIRRIVLFLTITLIVVISASELRAQSSEPPAEHGAAERESSEASRNGFCDSLCRLKEQRAQLLEGSWSVTVSPVVPPGVPTPPSFLGHATIARGGAFFGSDRTRPLSKQHGSWVHTGGSQFAWTFTEDLFDGMGNFTGTIKVRVRLVVTGDVFVGVSNGEQRDAFGVLVFNRCATVRGERIKIEPLSEQCQNIVPPPLQ